MPVATLRLAAMVALSTLALPARAQGALAGHVVDPNSGQAIAGATVSVDGTDLAAMTDAYGAYRIANVPGGTRAVSALATDYVGARAPAVFVGAGSTRLVDFALESTWPDLRIRGGQPVMGYYVGGQEVSSSLTYLLPSGATVGLLVGALLPASTGIPGYLLRPSAEAEQPGGAPQTGSTRIAPTGTARGSLVGHVLDPDTGRAIAGATVAIDGTDLRVMTDAFGTYRFLGVVRHGSEETHDVTASAAGRTPATAAALTVRAGAMQLLDFALGDPSPPDSAEISVRGPRPVTLYAREQRLPSTAAVGLLIGHSGTRHSDIPGYLVSPSDAAMGWSTLTGYVLDPVRGAPIAGARVAIDGMDDYTVTGADGRYRLRALDAGMAAVTASAPGYAAETATAIDIVAAATRAVDFTLARDGTVDAATLDAAPVTEVAYYVDGARATPYTVTRPSGVAIGEAREAILIGTIPARYGKTAGHWIMGATGEDAADDAATDDAAADDAAADDDE